MVVVQVNLAAVPRGVAADPIRAAAEQITCEKPLAILVRDDLAGRRFLRGECQGRSDVTNPDFQIELIETRLNLDTAGWVAKDLEHLHRTEGSAAHDVAACSPTRSLLRKKRSTASRSIWPTLSRSDTR